MGPARCAVFDGRSLMVFSQLNLYLMGTVCKLLQRVAAGSAVVEYYRGERSPMYHWDRLITLAPAASTSLQILAADALDDAR